MRGTTLFEEFPEVTTKEWKQQIQADLQGADYNKAMVWESPEGISVKPFYNHDDAGTQSPPMHRNGAWLIGQVIKGKNSEGIHKRLKACISLGAEALIVSPASEEPTAGWLPEKADRSTIPLFLEASFLSPPFLHDLCNAYSESSSKLHLCLDPIGFLARTGNWHTDKKKDLAVVSGILSQYQQANLGGILGIDGSLYQQAGANIVQQLGYTLAHVNEYMYLLKAEKSGSRTGFTPTFKLSVGGNYFFEIAKIRALRWLWRTLASAYGWDPKCKIIAGPGLRNKTLYDYNTNLIRSSMECMSAILGGSDVVYNLPYDTMYLERNDFSERIARNQLLIMKHEGLLERPLNPADGSYYIERLTRQLAEKSLDLFKDIEAGGGFLKLLGDHTIQRKIKESAQKEEASFRKGYLILTGTNLHVNKEDRMKSSIGKSPFLAASPRKTLIEPISVKRLAEEAEQSRLNHE